MRIIISRKEAVEQGLKRYFTGRPCKHGHVAGRGVSNGTCLECHRIHLAKHLGYALKPRRLEKISPIHITRAEAIGLGHKTYFTGLPCKHGHIAERRVGTADCIECDAARRQRRKDPKYRERENAAVRQRYAANPKSREQHAARKKRQRKDPKYWERELAAQRQRRAKQKAQRT